MERIRSIVVVATATVVTLAAAPWASGASSASVTTEPPPSSAAPVTTAVATPTAPATTSAAPVIDIAAALATLSGFVGANPPGTERPDNLLPCPAGGPALISGALGARGADTAAAVANAQTVVDEGESGQVIVTCSTGDDAGGASFDLIVMQSDDAQWAQLTGQGLTDFGSDPVTGGAAAGLCDPAGAECFAVWYREGLLMTLTLRATGLDIEGTKAVFLEVLPTLVSDLATGRFWSATGTQSSTLAVPTSIASGVVPEGWTVIVDDTQTITIAVPPTWTDVDTAPFGEWPTIDATPDRVAYDTDAGPGVYFSANEFSENPEWHSELAYHEENCVDNGAAPWTNGTFTGTVRVYTECSGNPTTAYRIVANPADGAFTAALVVQLAGAPDDATVLAGLLGSFGAVA